MGRKSCLRGTPGPSSTNRREKRAHSAPLDRRLPSTSGQTTPTAQKPTRLRPPRPPERPTTPPPPRRPRVPLQLRQRQRLNLHRHQRRHDLPRPRLAGKQALKRLAWATQRRKIAFNHLHSRHVTSILLYIQERRSCLPSACKNGAT